MTLVVTRLNEMLNNFLKRAKKEFFENPKLPSFFVGLKVPHCQIVTQ
jgi:hypothetical protein